MNYKIFSWVLILSGLIFPFSMVSPGSAQPDKSQCEKDLGTLNSKWEAKEGKDKRWTDTENFVWKQLCQEDVDEADLSTRSDKMLSFKFLKAILLKKEYNEKLPTRIIIKGAIFNEKISLKSENINKEVSLIDSEFNDLVDLSNSIFSKSLNFDKSIFYAGINLNDAKINGLLSFKGARFHAYKFNAHVPVDVKLPPLKKPPTDYRPRRFANILERYIAFEDKKLNPSTLFFQYPRDRCRTLINLVRVQVESSLNLQDTTFICSYSRRKIQQDDINLIDLREAKIKVSVNLIRISLKRENKKDETINKNLGVGLFAATIGGAIFIDQSIAGDANFIEQSKKIDYMSLVAEEIRDVTFLFIDQIIAQEKDEQSREIDYIDMGIDYMGLVSEEIRDVTFLFIDQIIAKDKDEQFSQIDYIDMSDVQAKSLVFFVDPEIANRIKNYRIFRIFSNRGSDDYTQLPVPKNYFFDLDIELENANIKKISILANQAQELESSSNDEDDFSSDDESDFSFNDEDNFFCRMKLSGFNYSQLNTTGFKFLTICIDSLYRNATRLADTPDQEEEVNRQLIPLLLAYYTADAEANRQLIQLLFAYIPDDQEAEANRQLIQLLQPIEQLSVVSKSLGVSGVEKEMMYRQKKLGYYLTKTNLSQSQSKFWNSLYSDRQSDDLQIELKEIWDLSWTLVSNIFQDFTSGYGFHRLRIFYIIIPILILNFFLGLFVSYQKQKKNAYESWYFKTKEIKDEKIGDYNLKQEPTFLSKKLGKGIVKQEPLTLQAVSQDIDTILQVIFKSHDADCFYLYFKYDNENRYDSYKEIKLNSGEFKYLIGILDNRNPTHTKVGFCKNYYPKGKWSVVTEIKPESPQTLEEVREISIYVIEREKLIKGITFESVLNALSNKISSEREKENQPKWITELGEKWIFSNQLAILLILLITIICQGIIVSSLFVLLFILLEITIFSFRKDENLAWITRKNLENAILFSFDILIPVIELDKENLDFILDAAEEYTLIRIYFRIEKLIGPLLISVLLPLLLLTGL